MGPPPRTPDLMAEKNGSTSPSEANKRRKHHMNTPENGRVNGNTNGSAVHYDTVIASAATWHKSKCIKQNITCLIVGIILGYFGHELYPSSSLDDATRGIFKAVISRHRRKHQEILAADDNNLVSPISAASEEIDRLHPIRNILEGASVFCQVEKQKEASKVTTVSSLKEATGIEIDWKKWKYGMTDDFQLTSEQTNIVKELGQRVVSKAANIRVCPDDREDCGEKEKQISSLSPGGTNMPDRSFLERVDSVPWGGNNSEYTRWWPRKDARDPNKAIEGGRLLAGYLKIMKYKLFGKFPHKLCEHGCDAELSVLHSLEWREKYKPWCLTPKTIEYNKNGFIYRRGNSLPGPRKRLEAQKAKDNESLSTSGHALLFYRPGVATVENPDLYARVMLHAIDSAVTESLVRNKGEIGRFNMIFDCKDFGSKNAPSLANVKKLFRYLQDHFPDRLGVLVVANLGGMAQMLFKMVLPFVTEDVRAKIHVIPNDDEGRREILLQFIEEDKIPTWLGGRDDYDFDAKEYYKNENCVLSEDDISNFLIDMPYHA